MADVTYSGSPTSYLPTIPGQAQLPAFLQGQQYNQQMGDYTNAVSMQNLSQILAAQKQKSELADYMSTRDSTNAATNASNDATTQTVLPLRQGQAASALAAGNVALGTQDSDIATKIAENTVKRGDAGMQQLQTGIKYAQMVGGLQGPTAASQAQDIATKMGINPDLAARVIKDPVGTTTWLNSIDQQVQAKLVAQKADNEQKGANSVVEAKERNKGELGAASITAAAHIQASQIMAAAGGSDKQLSTVVNRIQAAKLSGVNPSDNTPEADQLREDMNTRDYYAKLLVTKATAASQQGQAGTHAITDLPQPGQIPTPQFPGESGQPVPPLSGNQPAQQDPVPLQYQQQINQMSPAAQSWIQRARILNPNMNIKDILDQAKLKGKS